MKTKQNLIMRDQKNRPEMTTYLVNPIVVKGKKTAIFLCIVLLAILTWSFYVN